MKPVKSLKSLSLWVIRIVLLLLVYTISLPIILNTKPAFNIIFIFHLLFFICGILIFIGGFFRKHTITVISSIALAALSFYKIIFGYYIALALLAHYYF
jgi:hypothetical protein